MDAGLAGISGKELNAFIAGNSEIKTTYVPGLSASIGLVSEYYLDEGKHLGVSVGILSNFSAHTKHIESKFRDFFTQKIIAESESDFTFKLVNFQVPVKVVYRHKKMAFSFGMINNWLAAAELKQQFRSRGLNPETAWFEEPPTTISSSTVGNQALESSFIELGTRLDHRYTPQILFGVAYSIKNNLSLGLEFTNQLRNNYIHRTIFDIDVIILEKHEFKHNALNLSLIWWTERK